MKQRNIIATIGGYEEDETYTGRALVDEEYNLWLEYRSDPTVSLPTDFGTHKQWLKDESEEKIIGVIER